MNLIGQYHSQNRYFDILLLPVTLCCSRIIQMVETMIFKARPSLAEHTSMLDAKVYRSSYPYSSKSKQLLTILMMISLSAMPQMPWQSYLNCQKPIYLTGSGFLLYILVKRARMRCFCCAVLFWKRQKLSMRLSTSSLLELSSSALQFFMQSSLNENNFLNYNYVF